MIATDCEGGRMSSSSAPDATIRSSAAAWNCIPRPSDRPSNSSMTLSSGSMTRIVVGVYQTESISTRASMPITAAVFGPLVSSAVCMTACWPSA